MKTFGEFQGEIAKKDYTGKINSDVLKAHPELNPDKPGDYIKLKRLSATVRKAHYKPEGEVFIEDAAPTNNVGGGQIAGTVEAGDDPPVKKKKPPIMARGKLPGARTRFKAGADFLTNIKKNKYT